MYTQLTLQERESIEIHLHRGINQKEIANVLGRSPSSISREIKRNGVKKKGISDIQYLSKEAEIKSYQRRRQCKTQSMKINHNTKLKLFIIEQLKRIDLALSPKTITYMWNEFQKDKKDYITHTSIYKWLETGDGNKYKKYLLYKYKGYRKNKKEEKGGKIFKRRGIEQRTFIINNREEIGHFEADLIVSKKGFKGALLTLIDRKTRLPKIFKLKDKKSENVMNLLVSVKEELGIKSITFDNGMEFSKHYILHPFGIDTYFCNPYSSWEKGSIENLNRMIRRFYPKGTIFDSIHEKEIRSTCNILANTPREILGFISPKQAHFHNG